MITVNSAMILSATKQKDIIAPWISIIGFVKHALQISRICFIGKQSNTKSNEKIRFCSLRSPAKKGFYG